MWTVTVKLNALLLILGGLLFGVGLILGLMPMTQNGYGCGSAFIPIGYTMRDQCSDALSGWRGIAVALTIPGLLLAIIGAVMTVSYEKAPEA